MSGKFTFGTAAYGDAGWQPHFGTYMPGAEAFHPICFRANFVRFAPGSGPDAGSWFSSAVDPKR